MKKLVKGLGKPAARLARPLAKLGGPLKDAGAGWLEHNVSRMAAAIAYYGIFSLAPMLVIMVMLAGIWFGQDATEGLIVGRLSDTLGPDSARFIQSMLAGAHRSRGETLATVLAALLLVWSATRMIGATRSALNDIWGVKGRGGSGILGFVLGKLLDLGMVFGFGFMFLASMFASTAVSALTHYSSDVLPMPDWALQWIGVAFSLVVVTFFLAIIFRVLPNVKIHWAYILAGASATAVLFALGNYLIGRYLGQTSPGSVFGAAGSLAVIMIWMYYSAQIVLFGAEITRAYARRAKKSGDRRERGG